MAKRELPEQVQSIPATLLLWLSLVFLFTLAALPAQAQLRSHQLRFVPPADARVIGFHVYVSSNSMSYADWRDNVNFIPPVQSGAATYTLTGLEAADDVYIAMKSYDVVGAESAFSNEIVLAAQQQCLITGCNDNNPCTTDTCNAATGCVFDPAPNRGNTCNDGNATTFNDVCTTSGTCAGTQGQCNADAECGAPSNVCAGPRVCSNHMCVAGTPASSGTTCNDGNATTFDDVCNGAGTCAGTQGQCNVAADCGTSSTMCMGPRQCSNHMCVAGTPAASGTTCNDGNAMTFDDVCNGSGTCAGTQGQCNVNADCGTSSDVCAGPRVCSNHTCVAGTPAPTGTTCNDGNASTRYDICESGSCRGYACGSDANCSDNAACNGAERCVNRVCVAGTPMVCSDGDRCNGNETCVGSACVAGTAMQCPTEDGPCFDAFCDPAQGCRVQVHPDGSTCTTTTTSAAGMCASGLCVANTTPVPEDPRDPRPGGEEEPVTCATAYGAPMDIRQLRTDTPETSRKIAWSAPLHPMGALLEYRAEYESTWKSLRALPESSTDCKAIWSVTLVNLKPRVRYLYRVSGAAATGRVWSEILSLRTGPVSWRDRFKFAFFASNGLDSSAASPQASEVLTQIKKGGFPLVLGGGGYALSSEAMASGAMPDAGAAVTAWKEQARAVTGNSIFAPVLGDTEVESFTHAERAADYAGFMAASGETSAPTASYSYDFNGAHFLALHAPNLGTVHPSTSAGATHLEWIDDDLAAARAAGVRWIVVYMHADLFSSERGNTANAAVRGALGALFTKHGVNLVLSGEGDSYERTRALRGNLASPTAAPLSEDVTTANDGIVFVRAGSGGRTDFGDWLSTTPPAWSAVRNNDRAVFLKVTVDENTLGVTAFGVDAKGKKLTVDRVRIH